MLSSFPALHLFNTLFQLSGIAVESKIQKSCNFKTSVDLIYNTLFEEVVLV